MKLNLETGGLNLKALQPEPAQAIAKTPKAKASANPDAFAKALASADTIAKASDKAGEELMSGQIELHEAMVRMEKADLMLKLGTTVRNKLLDAYQQLLSSAGG